MQKLINMAMSGELMISHYTTPLSPVPSSSEIPTNEAKPTNVTTSINEAIPTLKEPIIPPPPLFPVEEDEPLFSPLEEKHAPLQEGHTPLQRPDSPVLKFRELLTAIENFDR